MGITAVSPKTKTARASFHTSAGCFIYSSGQAASLSAARGDRQFRGNRVRDNQQLTSLNVIVVIDSINPRQPMQVNAISLGDLRQILPTLHHVMDKARLFIDGDRAGVARIGDSENCTRINAIRNRDVIGGADIADSCAVTTGNLHQPFMLIDHMLRRHAGRYKSRLGNLPANPARSASRLRSRFFSTAAANFSVFCRCLGNFLCRDASTRIRIIGGFGVAT